MDKSRERLKYQLQCAKKNVLYTYVAHWVIVNSLTTQYRTIKIVQIVLTAISSCGFFAYIVSCISWLSWTSCLTSVVSLGINLYMLNFNVEKEINSHIDAANDLWIIRESYESLLVDFDELDNSLIRERRNELQNEVSRINKTYPGTDEKSFKKAQESIGKYGFKKGELEDIIKA